MKGSFRPVWLGAAVLAAAPALAQGAATDLDLAASAWDNIAGSDGWLVTIPLYNDAQGHLYLDVPAEPDTRCVRNGKCDTINYLWSNDPPQAISGWLVMTLRVDATSGAPVFHHDEKNTQCPNNPPTVRPFIWADSNPADSNRWWAHSVSYVLAPGIVTLMVEIVPENFSGVEGQQATDDLEDWNSAINNVSSLGVTFGGGCAFGHGVFVTNGAARFTVEEYSVVPDCPGVSPCPGLTGDCVRGKEIGATNTGTGQCMMADDALLDCGAQSVFVVGTACRNAPCCTQNPPCLCLICPTGQYLECR